MGEAVSKIKSGLLSTRAASKIYNIPRATLIKKKKLAIVEKAKFGPKTVLTEAEEHVFVDWLDLLCKIGFPRPDQALLKEVQKIITDDERDNPFVNDKPGRKWLELFLKRNPDLTYRKPEAV